MLNLRMLNTRSREENICLIFQYLIERLRSTPASPMGGMGVSSIIITTQFALASQSRIELLSTLLINPTDRHVNREPS